METEAEELNVITLGPAKEHKRELVGCCCETQYQLCITTTIFILLQMCLEFFLLYMYTNKYNC